MLTFNNDIYSDEDIPYFVKGVWATICSVSERIGTILIVPEYVKESKEFRFAKGYLEGCGKIRGVTENDDIILNWEDLGCNQ